MIYIIQNSNASDTINEFNFNHFHSLIKVSKIHEKFEYLKFIQQNINPYIALFNRLTYKEMKIFCLNQIVKISNQNIYFSSFFGIIFICSICSIFDNSCIIKCAS